MWHKESVTIQYFGGHHPLPPFLVSMDREGLPPLSVTGKVTELKAWPIRALHLPGNSLYGSEADV